LAIGGNKARKLELLMAAALAERADTVITTGAADSNHCRMTAAAAAKLGLGCVLLLGTRAEPPAVQGNLLLDHLLGAEVQFYPAGGKLSGNQLLPEVEQAVRARGRRPYAFPSGGSTGLGAIGYALAMRELLQQLAELGVEADYVVHSSGSGGTHAGLLLGAALNPTRLRVLAMNTDEPVNDALEARTRSVYADGAGLLGLAEGHQLPEFNLITGYVGDGYGLMSSAGAEAIRLVARTEGLLLDPVYTGKAMAGLIDMIRTGAIGQDKTVVFLHTGGSPALFTQADALVEAANLRPTEPARRWVRATR
jgi:D-cysteine desulfhydrase